MPFRSIAHIPAAMSPLTPEDKCSSRKRRRPSATTTTASTRALQDEDIMAAALIDFDCPTFECSDDADEVHAFLKRQCVAAEETLVLEEEQLSEEVQSLKNSVHSMAQDVAKVSEKIAELRDLISIYMQQQGTPN